jgi:Na+-transporting NADH:ubiquinone oxidoreductase subunit NqrB
MATELLTERREERSAASVLQNIVKDLRDIVRSEIQLAKTEMSEKATKAGQGAGMLGTASVLGLLAAAALVTTCIAAWAIVIPVWAGALIMAFILGVAGTIAYSRGRNKLKQVHPVPEQTARTIREDVEWAKQRTK